MTNLWDVFLLFLIPVGGGIPAGLVLAQGRGVAWPQVMGLYFISDIVQAFIFEGIVVLFVFGAKHSAGLNRFVTAFSQSMQKTISRYGLMPGSFALVMISFGADALTGRTAALAAGHGFVMGWLHAIAGDMIFFTVIMVSTLWLNSILGDGTWTAVIITLTMLVVPALIRRARGRKPGEIKK